MPDEQTYGFGPSFNRPASASGTGWTETPYYKIVSENQPAEAGQAQQAQQNQQAQAAVTTKTYPQSEFMVKGKYGEYPVSIAPETPLTPFDNYDRIVERTEGPAGMNVTTASGATYQVTQKGAPEPQPQAQPTIPSAMVSPYTGKFAHQGEPEYTYYMQPASGSTVEIFHGGHLIPTESGTAAVEVSGLPYFSVGSDWKQVEVQEGYIKEVPKTYAASQATAATTYLAASPKAEALQEQGFAIPTGAARLLESQGYDWAKEVPAWTEEVYRTGQPKKIMGLNGEYFEILPLAGGASIGYQPPAKTLTEKIQITDYPTYSVVNRYKPGEATPYISEVIAPGSQFASQADLDKWTEQMREQTTFSGQYEQGLKQVKAWTPMGDIEIGKALIDIKTPLTGTSAYQYIVPTGIVDLGIRMRQETIAAGGGSFEAGVLPYWTGKEMEAGKRLVALTPIGMMASLTPEGKELATAREAGFQDVQKNIPAIVEGGIIGGAISGTAKILSMRQAAAAQKAALEQHPTAEVTYGKRVGGTLEEGVHVTETGDVITPGLIDEEFYNKLLAAQAKEGIPVKDISISSGGANVVYSSGTYFPDVDNPFTGTLKTEGGLTIPATIKVSTPVGEFPSTLGEGMMTSGYIPDEVSASFIPKYKVVAEAPSLPSLPEAKVDLSAAYNFFDIKAGPEYYSSMNPFEGVRDVAWMKPEAAARMSEIVAWNKVALGEESAGIRQLFGTDWRTAGSEVIPFKEVGEAPWYEGTGVEKIYFQKIPSDYWTTGVKYPYAEIPEGAVVSPESYRGIMLGVEKIDFNLPEGSPGWNLGNLGIEEISFKAPREINLALTEADKSLIRGYAAQNLVEEMKSTGELSATATERNLDGLVQQQLKVMQKSGQVFLGAKQVTEPLGAEATAQAYGISPQMFAYTIPQASEAAEWSPASAYPAKAQEPASKLSFLLPTSRTKTIPGLGETEDFSETFNIRQPTKDIERQASSDMFKMRRGTPAAEIDTEKFKDLITLKPVESEGVFQKQGEKQITITTQKVDIPWKPYTPGETPFQPTPTKISLPDNKPGIGQPQRKFAGFAMAKGKAVKTSFAPIADPWSKTMTEIKTGRPARSPPVAIAKKFWQRSGGEFVPTEEMLESAKRIPKKQGSQSFKMKFPKFKTRKRKR